VAYADPIKPRGTISATAWALRVQSRRVSTSRAPLFSKILDPGDLDGDGWAIFSDHAWKVGAGQPLTDQIRRARQQHGITVRRCLRDSVAMRSILVMVQPFASSEDALTQPPSRPIQKPFTRSGPLVPPRAIDGIAVDDAVIVAAYETTSNPVSNQILNLAVDNFRVGLLVGNRGEDMPWAELLRLRRSKSESCDAPEVGTLRAPDRRDGTVRRSGLSTQAPSRRADSASIAVLPSDRGRVNQVVPDRSGGERPSGSFRQD